MNLEFRTVCVAAITELTRARRKVMECTLFCFTGSKDDDDDHSLTCEAIACLVFAKPPTVKCIFKCDVHVYLVLRT